MTIHYAEAVLHMVKPEEPKAPTVPEVHIRKCRHGLMAFFPHDFYLGGALERYGEYAEEESKLLLSYINEGDFVVEVGANIGCHTVALARKVGNAGRVLAFEPQRIIFQMLCANLSINALWNVMAERVALGEAPGVLQVPPVDYASPGNFGGVALGTVGAEPVQVVKLDAYALARCNLLKIDVEGMELEVLRGAVDTITRTRPILYVENDRQEKSAALVAFLRALNYDLYWHLPPLFSPDNWQANQVNDFGGVVSANMLCLPHERGIGSTLPPVVAASGTLQ